MAVNLPGHVGPPAIAIICLNKVAALFLDSSPTFAVNVALPSQPPRMALDALMRLFKLTEAEGRLVEALLTTGGGLRVASERLEITRNTAKTQLTTIFRKTGTNSQAKLLRLFGSAFTRSGDDL